MADELQSQSRSLRTLIEELLEDNKDFWLNHSHCKGEMRELGIPDEADAPNVTMGQLRKLEALAVSETVPTPEWKPWTEQPPEVREPTAYPVLVADDADSNNLKLTVAEWGPSLHRSGASNYGDVWRCAWDRGHIRNWLPVDLRGPCERLVNADRQGEAK